MPALLFALLAAQPAPPPAIDLDALAAPDARQFDGKEVAASLTAAC